MLARRRVGAKLSFVPNNRFLVAEKDGA